MGCRILDYNKLLKIIGLSMGAILVLVGFFITPIFVASHFSPDGILEESTIQGIQVIRFLAAVSGIFVIVFCALIYMYPSMVNKFFDFVSYQGKRFQTRHFYLPFCFACFIIALILGLFITQSGSGISPDSTSYISAGKNVYSGNGFYIGYPGNYHPYVVWPPLYPLSIAAFMHFGLDAEQSARLVPILCFALLMFPLFFLGKVLGSTFVGYIACLTCLVFTPLWQVTSYAWTEMIYIFFSVLSILYITRFVENDNTNIWMLCVGGLFTSLAILTRYIGVTLLLVGLIAIVLKSKSQLRNMICQILLFGSISSLPIVIWIYRNLILTGHMSGGNRWGSHMGLLTNIHTTIITVWRDFIGVSLPEGIGLLTISLLIIILIAVYIRINHINLISNSSPKYFKKNYVTILYVVIYLGTLILIRSVWHFDNISYRLTCPVYPFLIVMVISTIIYVYKHTTPALKQGLFLGIIILGIPFLIIHASTLIVFYQSAQCGQGYNSPFWKNNPGIGWVENNVRDNVTVYSDRPDAIQFRLKRQSRYLPHTGNDIAINKFFMKLKNEKNSYIICFNNRRRSYLLSNDEIIEMNQKYDALVVVADFPGSTIYKTKDNPC
ncbi:MAG: ArnT family glycosyltransferase [Methanotrichaceae archaeon]